MREESEHDVNYLLENSQICSCSMAACLVQNSFLDIEDISHAIFIESSDNQDDQYKLFCMY